jgi:serine/threonine protein kinase
VLRLCGFSHSIVLARGGATEPWERTDAGTLWYRPPESLLGLRKVSCAADLWATGCVWVEMLTGQPLFSSCTTEYGKRVCRHVRALKRLASAGGGESFCVCVCVSCWCFFLCVGGCCLVVFEPAAHSPRLHWFWPTQARCCASSSSRGCPRRTAPCALRRSSTRPCFRTGRARSALRKAAAWPNCWAPSAAASCEGSWRTIR